MDGNLSFNTNSLQTYNPATDLGVIANVIDHTDGPDSIFDMVAIANANRSAAGNNDSPGKTILVGGVIKGSSGIDLDQRIDAFKRILIGKDKNLDINYGGTTRRYIATAPTSGIKIKRKGSLFYAPFTVQFLCSDAYGYEITPTVIINETGHTTATYTATPTIDGSAEFQLPIFTITINSLTGAGDYVQLSNNANNQSMLIYGEGLANGDVIVVDSAKREVTINGGLIYAPGAFFELELGPASLTYSDGFTTRNVNIHAEYYKRYS